MSVAMFTPDDPLDNVIDKQKTGTTVLAMQSGLFNLAYKRALASGTIVSKPDDLQALEDHARAMARETYREKFDPSLHAHDAMHQAEYEKALVQREDAEKGELQATANLRDSEENLARTPKAGSPPALSKLVVAAFVAVFAITVAPTLHDFVFHTLSDDLLAWFLSAVCGVLVGCMLTWTILNVRSGKSSWIGVGAGVVLGLGLLAVRLSSAQGGGEVLFALGLTVVEIAAVLLLEHLARDIRVCEADWNAKLAVESQARERLRVCQQDLSRWQAKLQEKQQTVNDKIALVEDRFNRNMNIEELEEAAIKAVRDGYNRGLSENIGRIHGVAGRAQ